MWRPLTVLGIGLLVPGVSAAQHCHTLGASAAQQPGFHLELGVEAAGYKNPRYEGSYEGLYTSIGWTHEKVSVSAMAPFYRLERNGLRTTGLGDLLLAVQAPLWRSQHDSTSLGLGMTASLPTGSRDEGLGMGHVMVMPGAWGRWSAGAFSALGQVAYGRALGSGAAHHGGGPAPLVNPMNSSELSGALGLAWDLSSPLQLRGRMEGAVPIGSSEGESRAMAGLGVLWRMGSFSLGLEGQVPLVGRPFTARALATTNLHF